MPVKTLMIAVALASLAIALPAQADTVLGGTKITSTGATSTAAQLSQSDEEFLSEMPMKDFPGADQLQDADGNGIVDGDPAEAMVGSPEDAEDKADTAKAKVKYVYKGESQYMLRRSIQDDRIEDGYVQGLMKQKGPK